MFCPNCGNELSGNNSFCGRCGSALNPSKPGYQQTATISRIGFSPKINDPAFNKYKKKSVTWSFLFAGILAIIAIIAFPIYGNKSGDIDWPESLYYGMGIGGMFLVIAMLQTIKRSADKTWDGVVFYKNSYSQRESDDDGHSEYHRIYEMKIRKDSGATKTHKWKDTQGLYGYYDVGDRIRHHKGFSYYEKYDKSRDSQIMCIACMSFQDINQEVCKRCKCPLLK